MQDLHDKRVTVAGLGQFGGQVAAAQWLAAQGARVLVTDKEPADKLADSLRQLDGLPITFRLGEHRAEDFSQADLIVASPAIPPRNEYLKAAREAGVPITTEIRLFIERCPASIVGVTGTKGKSTVTDMIGHILQTRGTAWVGGNIGRPLILKLGQIEPNDWVVLELSSYMLEHLGAMHWSPKVAVVTMLAADHLEWHGSKEAYIAAKSNIVRFQKPGDVAVLCEEHAPSLALAQMTQARIVPFGIEGRQPIPLKLRGRHNQLNAQAACATAEALGIGRDISAAALADYRGLPHRLELVHSEAGVEWYNDSIATIPEAAVAALDSFPERRVIQIVGGHDHGLPIDEMCEALLRRAKSIICIGKAAGRIVEAMARQGLAGGAPVYAGQTLPDAMRQALKLAAPGDVVLLSTGFKSYGEFTNFEKRGEAFAALARGDSKS